MHNAIVNLGCGLILLCLSCTTLPEVPPPDSYRTFPTPLESDIAAASTVDFCRLVEHPASYNRTLVRVKGRLRSAFEESTLFSPACANDGVFFWVDTTVDRFSGPKAVARLRVLTPTDGSVETDVVVVGQFEDGVTNDRRYGHMGGYRMQLIVFKIDD